MFSSVVCLPAFLVGFRITIYWITWYLWVNLTSQEEGVRFGMLQVLCAEDPVLQRADVSVIFLRTSVTYYVQCRLLAHGHSTAIEQGL
jgi:hypothetical protein